ncbi:MAG: hypothetical protein QNJ97_26235, partial [Myxococcota bacterium]|nr:hypothetical protein [Myxococcota bacterium]
LKTIAWTIENPPAPFFKGDSFLAILRYKNTQKSLTECHCAKGAGGISSLPLALQGDKIPLTPFFKGEFDIPRDNDSANAYRRARSMLLDNLGQPQNL